MKVNSRHKTAKHTSQDAGVISSEKRYREISEILGENSVSEPVASYFDFVSLAGKGIAADAIEHFNSYFDLTKESTAHLLNVSEPTLYRWAKSGKPLERNYSVQLFELADLFLFGISVFGSRDKLFQWLRLPNLSFGGIIPFELLEIPGGIEKVRDAIGRIEYGVYS